MPGAQKQGGGGGGGAGGGGRVIIIKKKGGHAAHHGGAWKVAYADFVTALMALFMVLWLVSQTDQSDRDVLSQYFRTGVFPEGGTTIMEKGDGLHEGTQGMIDNKSSLTAGEQEQVALEKSAQKLRKAVRAQADLKELAANVKVRTVDRGLLIEIVDSGDDFFFDLSSSELKPRMVKLLQTIATTLQRIGNPLEVHGHTDARPFPKGAEKDNWTLSYERAKAARDVMEGAGLTESRFSGVFAHGSADLYTPDKPFDPSNRRISILAVRASEVEKAKLSRSGTIGADAYQRKRRKEARAARLQEERGDAPQRSTDEPDADAPTAGEPTVRPPAPGPTAPLVPTAQ